MLTSASRVQQRIARVLTFTVQPNTAEMYFIDTFIDIAYVITPLIFHAIS